MCKIIGAHSATGCIQIQVEKNIRAIRAKSDPLDKHIHLSALQDRNETLFFRVLIDYIEELGALSMPMGGNTRTATNLPLCTVI